LAARCPTLVFVCRKSGEDDRVSKEEVEYIAHVDAPTLLAERAATEKARVVSLRQTVADVKADEAAAQLSPQATPLECVERMWEAYQERQSARYVAAVTGVSVGTAAKYINTGDAKRNVVPFKVRWKRASRSRVTLSQTEERIEYGDRQALEEALDQLRDVDAWVSSLLAHGLKTSMNPGKMGLDVKEQTELVKAVAPLLQLSISMKEKLLGVKVTARKGMDESTTGPGGFFPGLDDSVTSVQGKPTPSARQLAQPQRQPFQAPNQDGAQIRLTRGTEREDRTPVGGDGMQPDSDSGGRAPVVVSSGLLPSESLPVPGEEGEDREAQETEPSVWQGEEEEQVETEDAVDYQEEEDAEDQEEEETPEPESTPRMTATGGSRTEEDRDERREETKRRTDREEKSREESAEETDAENQDKARTMSQNVSQPVSHNQGVISRQEAGDERRAGAGGHMAILPNSNIAISPCASRPADRFPRLG
jgi:hypothetical protein